MVAPIDEEGDEMVLSDMRVDAMLCVEWLAVMKMGG